jgi:hypothetical protein
MLRLCDDDVGGGKRRANSVQIGGKFEANRVLDASQCRREFINISLARTAVEPKIGFIYIFGISLYKLE